MQENHTRHLATMSTFMLIGLLATFTSVGPTWFEHADPVTWSPGEMPSGSASAVLTEDFSTTTMLDPTNTNASGWGDGQVTLPPLDPLISQTSVPSPYAIKDVHVLGQHAYIVTYGRIDVYDVSVPSTPVLVNTHSIVCKDVAFVGNLAYVAAGAFGMIILNISNPLNLVVVGSIDSYRSPDPWFDDLQAEQVAVSGSYVYLWDVRQDGLIVIHAGDLSSPVHVGGLYSYSFAVNDLLYHNNHLFVVPAGLVIIDVSNPTSPFERAEYYLGHWWNKGFLEGSLMFLAGGTHFDILNVSNPGGITLMSSTPSNGIDFFDVHVENQVAYLAGGEYIGSMHYDGFVQLFSVSNPTSPDSLHVHASSLNPMVGPCYYASIEVHGGVAYAMEAYQNTFMVVDFNNLGKHEPLAVAQSLPVLEVEDAFFFSSVNVSVVASIVAGTTMEFFISADNGSNWEQVVPDVPHALAHPGCGLKFKIRLSTTDVAASPVLHELHVHAMYHLNPPDLVSPGDLAVVLNNTPHFHWSSVTHASNYAFQLDVSAGFNSSHLRDLTIATNQHLPSMPLAKGTWYWRVAAIDGSGQPGPFSGPWQVLVNSTISLAPALSLPQNQACTSNADTTFSWSAVTYSSNYTLELDTTPFFTSPALETITNITSTSHARHLDDGSWYWRVFAVDILGNPAAASAVRCVIVDTVNPVIEDLAGQHVTATPFSLNWIASDANPSHFHITRDGSVIKNEAWAGTNISVTIEALNDGTYIFNCTVFDKAGNQASSTLTVEVSTSENGNDEPARNELAGFDIFLVLGSACCATSWYLGINQRKRARRKELR